METKTKFDEMMATETNAGLAKQAGTAATAVDLCAEKRNIANQPSLEEYRQKLNYSILIFNSISEAKRSIVGNTVNEMDTHGTPFDEQVIATLRRMDAKE
tara:strand:- start:330 stop:629 length:300 start_codon:yes stop_codon:yes gene_type:complete